MSKKILSLLLVLALVVAVSVFAVEASNVEKIAFDESAAVDGVVTAWCDACEQNVEWTKATLSSGKVVLGEHIYVSNSYTSSSPMKATAITNIEGTVCLYLNGVITNDSNASTDIFNLGTTATEKTDCVLNIMGSDTGMAKLVTTNDQIVQSTTNASAANGGINKLAIYGGNFDGTKVTGTSGAMVYADETISAYTQVEVHGGVITGGSPKFTGTNYHCYGGTINLAGAAVFTMTGGVIQDGSAQVTADAMLAGGGNIRLGAGSTFTMSGGKILNGTAYSSGSKSTCIAYGGNVYVESTADAQSTVTITGGEISGGKVYAGYCPQGGNLCVGENAIVNISATTGETLIAGGLAQGRSSNYSGDYHRGGRGGNIYFTSGTLNISGGQIKNGVCAESAVNGTTGLTNTDSACRGGNLYIGDGTVTITSSTFYNRNGSAVAWMGGNIYVAKGKTYIKSGEFVGGRASRGGSIGIVGGTLYIQGGEIRGGTAISTGGCIHCEGTINMTGGKITNALESDGLVHIVSTADDNGGVVYVGKTFTMNGVNAVIEGGESNYGGTISIGQGSFSSSNYGTFTLKNGTINGGVATKQGGAIQVRSGGKCTISGGTVNPGTAGTNAAGLVVNGTGKLTIANGLTSRLDVFFDSSSIVDNKVSTDKVVVDGYTNGGMVVYERDGVMYPVVGSGTELVLADAAVTNGDGEILAIPADAQAAVGTELADGEFIKLFQPDQTIELTRTTTIDFNGKDAEITSGTGYLIGMDSAANGYTADGLAKVIFAENPTLDNVVNLTVNGKNGQRKYLALDNGDGTYSFHRYYISMDKAGLRTDSNDGVKGPGISYSAVFRGDEAVVNAISAYGVAFTVLGNETKYPYTDALAATERNEGKMLAVHGMMNAEYGATPVSGKAYIVVNGETIYSTDAATNNLQALVETYAAQYSAAKLPDIFQTSVGAMLKKYAANMKAIGWNVPEVA